MSKYSEYSKLRSKARKRAERLASAGLSQLVTFPTVKELKASGIPVEQAVKNVQSFLDAPTKTREYRKIDEAQRPVFTQKGNQVVITPKDKEKRERRKQQNREASRRYRERKKAMTSDEVRLLESARSLGINIPPRYAKEFSEYMKYRYDAVKESEYYLHEKYAREFQQAMKAGHKPSDIIKDFEEYLSDVDDWKKSHADDKEGLSGDAFNELYKRYVGLKDAIKLFKDIASGQKKKRKKKKKK